MNSFSFLAEWAVRSCILILGGALPQMLWVHNLGIAFLWIAAAMTLVSGYDYLRTGLKHMD